LSECLVVLLVVLDPLENLLLEPRLEQGTAAQQEKVQPQQEELVALEQISLLLHLQGLDPFDEQRLLLQFY
jgi:hypothetical protein